MAGAPLAHTAGCKCGPCMEPQERQSFANGGWIKGATKNKGGLHRSLGVPEGQNIPPARITAATHSDNPRVRKQANLAKTLKAMHRVLVKPYGAFEDDLALEWEDYDGGISLPEWMV